MADNGARKMKERSAFVYCAWPVSGKEAATTLKAPDLAAAAVAFQQSSSSVRVVALGAPGMSPKRSAQEVCAMQVPVKAGHDSCRHLPLIEYLC